MHFGRGLVETADDFGTQGALPTHPELLDSLAVQFVESGWNIKAIHKALVMSATYRQTSDATQEHLARDPRNLLYARGPRTRASIEVLRDSALSLSGLLSTKVGGPSVFPYQPDGIWSPTVTRFMYPATNEVPAEDHHRRSLYTFVKRNAPPPTMTIFDLPERTRSHVARRSSNTPLQALVLWNDPQFVEAYRLIATRALKSEGDTDARLALVYRIATRLQPTPNQLTAMRAFYEAELSRFRASLPDAEKLVHVGVTPLEAGVDVTALAAMTNLTSAVMNSPDSYTIHWSKRERHEVWR
jgi:hypothetical protein